MFRERERGGGEGELQGQDVIFGKVFGCAIDFPNHFGFLFDYLYEYKYIFLKLNCLNMTFIDLIYLILVWKFCAVMYLNPKEAKESSTRGN